jgi:hypothetical protein
LSLNTFKNLKRWITTNAIFRTNIFSAITRAVDLLLKRQETVNTKNEWKNELMKWMQTLAKGTGGSLFLSLVAAISYSGANRLQCPHQGAKNSTKTVSCWPTLDLKSPELKSITSELITVFMIDINVKHNNEILILEFIFIYQIVFFLSLKLSLIQ